MYGWVGGWGGIAMQAWMLDLGVAGQAWFLLVPPAPPPPPQTSNLMCPPCPCPPAPDVTTGEATESHKGLFAKDCEWQPLYHYHDGMHMLTHAARP